MAGVGHGHLQSRHLSTLDFGTCNPGPKLIQAMEGVAARWAPAITPLLRAVSESMHMFAWKLHIHYPVMASNSSSSQQLPSGVSHGGAEDKDSRSPRLLRDSFIQAMDQIRHLTRLAGWKRCELLSCSVLSSCQVTCRAKQGAHWDPEGAHRSCGALICTHLGVAVAPFPNQQCLGDLHFASARGLDITTAASDDL